MTPERLREHAKEWDIDGRYSIAEIFRAHADALEEIERLNGEGQIMQGFYNAAMDRAERAEAALAEAERKGREQGMREAAGLCQSFQPKDFTAAGIMTRAQCADAILAAIGEGK